MKDPYADAKKIYISVMGQPTDMNKAKYTATPVACGWAGAIIKVTRSFGQEQ